MENWGLITYGESYFAVNDETSPASQKQIAASIMAHEIAHQVLLFAIFCHAYCRRFDVKLFKSELLNCIRPAVDKVCCTAELQAYISGENNADHRFRQSG
jgi:hypothetical protein